MPLKQFLVPANSGRLRICCCSPQIVQLSVLMSEYQLVTPGMLANGVCGFFWCWWWCCRAQEVEELIASRDQLTEELEHLAASHTQLLMESMALHNKTEDLLAENVNSLVELGGKLTAAQVCREPSAHDDGTAPSQARCSRGAGGITASSAATLEQHSCHSASAFVSCWR